jgi:hypothetical protein
MTVISANIGMATQCALGDTVVLSMSSMQAGLTALITVEAVYLHD